MIEQTLKAIIEELGATGVLLVGLTFIALRLAKEISAPLKVINGELGEIRDLLKEAVIRLKK